VSAHSQRIHAEVDAHVECGTKGWRVEKRPRIAGQLARPWASSASPQAPLLLVAACAVALPCMGAWGELVGVNVGLDESLEGVVNRHHLGSELIGWQDIERFDHRKRGISDQVYAVLREGPPAQPIVSLQEGQRVVWEGGQTRNITAVLNERLRRRRR
jgi:hypothetical protein